MSDNFIVLVPVDPEFVPADSPREQARRLLEAAFPKAEEVTATVAASPELVHSYANWSGVRCARCKTTLDDDWWKAAVDLAAAGSFHQLLVVLPCCGAIESLNDLDYVWTTGFARLQLVASNPNVAVLPPELIAQVEGILGTKVRVVFQHL